MMDIIPYLFYSFVLFVIIHYVSCFSINKYILFGLEIILCAIFYFSLFAFSRLKGFKIIREMITKYFKKKKKNYDSKNCLQNSERECKKINLQINGLRAFLCVAIIIFVFFTLYCPFFFEYFCKCF